MNRLTHFCLRVVLFFGFPFIPFVSLLHRKAQRLLLIAFLATLYSVPDTIGTTLLASAPSTVSIQTAEPQVLIGWFSVEWQDDLNQINVAEPVVFPVSVETYLMDVESIDGELEDVFAQLLLDETTLFPDGPPEQLNRQRVRVEAVLDEQADPAAAAAGPWQILKMEALPLEGDVGGVSANTGPEEVAGSQPWVIIRCNFPDLLIPATTGTEPGATGYYEALLNNANGLNAYFSTISNGMVNLDGSTVEDVWFPLPQNRADYALPNQPNVLNISQLGEDCINAANPTVDFTDFTGIGMVFNHDDCCWGGSRTTELDGERRTWGTVYMTVDAPHLIWAHEIGHGFGLHHASGNGQEYNNPWSIMGLSACFGAADPIIGCIGQYPVADQLATGLGWLPANRQVTVPSGQSRVISLERLAEPATPNPQLVRVPIQGSSTRYYTVEARQRIGFDANLPGDSVVIHLVDLEKQSSLQFDVVGEPARDSYYFPSDAAIWLPGRDFVDEENNITIQVLEAAASGYTIKVASGALALQAVSLSGPDVSLDNTVSFLADATPVTASLPITYLWEATDLPPQTLVGGTNNTVEFRWSTPGQKTVTVTASNGSSQAIATKEITILGADLVLSNATTGTIIDANLQKREGAPSEVTYLLDVANLGPDGASDALLTLSLDGLESFTVGDDSGPDFSNGSMTDTAYNSAAGGLTLNSSGLSAGQGSYQSAIFDGGTAQNWSTIEWQPAFPSGRALPNGNLIETVYTTGNADMRENVLLLHLDEPDTSTAFANSAGFVAAEGRCASATCPTLNVEGRYGTAADFDGSQGVTIEASPRLNFDLDGFSQEVWIYPTVTNGISGSAVQGIVGAITELGDYPSLYYEEQGIRFRFSHQNGSTWIKSSDSIAPNRWNHVAVAYDGTTLALYINGDEKYSSDAWAGSVPRPAPTGIELGRIGDTYFSGRIDEMAIYRRALTGIEVAERYQRGVTNLGFQVRSCETADCALVPFLGPDGTSESYYTEAQFGATRLARGGQGIELPWLTLGFPSPQQYIQYRASLESEDRGESPLLKRVTLVPTYGNPTSGNCRGTARIVCDLGDIAEGDAAQIEVAFDVDDGSSIQAEASVLSATFDPSTGNNSASTNLGDGQPPQPPQPPEPVTGTTPRGQLVTFESTIDAGTDATYTWDFGDGNMATGNPITHIYVSLGTYTITLVVQSENGLETETRQVQVLDKVYLPNVFP